jgi:hypothetical protein
LSTAFFDWQEPNPHARFLEHNRAPVIQGFLDVAEIREEHTHLLFRTTLRGSPE